MVHFADLGKFGFGEVELGLEPGEFRGRALAINAGMGSADEVEAEVGSGGEGEAGEKDHPRAFHRASGAGFDMDRWLERSGRSFPRQCGLCPTARASSRRSARAGEE